MAHIPWPGAQATHYVFCDGDFPANLKYWIIRDKLSKNPLPSHLRRLSLMDPNPRQVDNRNSILKWENSILIPSRQGLDQMLKNTPRNKNKGFSWTHGLIKMWSQRTRVSGKLKLAGKQIRNIQWRIMKSTFDYKMQLSELD